MGGENQTISDEGKAAEEARFQEQCFLMRAMGIDKGSIGSKLDNPKKNYEHLIKVTGEASLIMSALTAVPGAEALFGITDRELAFLQPMIRLFKVNETGGKGTTETEFRFSEGSFDASTNKSIFTNRDTRGSDVGIESVSFELLATNPAEITNNIKCSIKLFFQNLDSLEKDRGGYRYADLILRPKKSPSSGPNTVPPYNPNDYRIKLIVGWAIPSVSEISNKLKDALRRSRTVLNLTLKDHTFNFKMDGTVSLDIEYQAWAEGALSDPATDLLYPSGNDTKIIKQLEAAEEYKRDEKADYIKTKTGKDPANPMPVAGGKPEDIEDPPDTDGYDDDIESIRTKRLELKRAGQTKAYKRFMNMLLANKNANIYYIDIPASQLGMAKDESMGAGARNFASTVTGGAIDPADATQATRKYSRSANKSSCGDLRDLTDKDFVTQKPPLADTSNNEKQMGDVYESSKDKGEMSIRGNVGEEVTSALEHLRPDMAPNDNGNVRVNYFFFGDLLNMCLELLANGDGQEIPSSPEYKKSPVSKVEIMLGPMLLTNPCDPKSRPIDRNLADLPISLNIFQAWFLKKVIRRQLSTYLLRNFINDMINELIPAALGEQCVESAGRNLVRINTNIINLRGDGASPPLKKNTTTDVAAISSMINRIDWSTPISKKKTHDYLLLYATGFSPDWLGGDKSADLAKGIYHFSIGAAKGIIKKMTFEKNDAPYLGEMKVTGQNNIANDLGGGAIYNFNAELIGNNLFVPGQYVYVDPHAMGLGNPSADGRGGTENSIANRLRLGGYYNISKVESILSRGAFSTSISGIWESNGGAPETQPVRKKAGEIESYGPAAMADIEAGLAAANVGLITESPGGMVEGF